jgi:hypothetical protein
MDEHPYTKQIVIMAGTTLVSVVGAQYWVHRKEMELFLMKDKTEKERANLSQILEILPETVMLVSEQEPSDLATDINTDFKNHEDE